MTYFMKTLNKGEIEVSYTSALKDYNVGEYTFGGYTLSVKDLFTSLYKIAKRENNFEIPLSNGDKVNINWDERKETLKLGEYKINKEELEAVSRYLFMGGFFGWNPKSPEWKPGFVREHLKNIESLVKNKDPINPCFKNIPIYVKSIDAVRKTFIHKSP